MDLEDKLNALSKEEEIERRYLQERFKVSYQEIEPTFLHIQNLQESFFYLLVNSGSATSSTR